MGIPCVGCDPEYAKFMCTSRFVLLCITVRMVIVLVHSMFGKLSISEFHEGL